jgi:hypothetical protein
MRLRLYFLLLLLPGYLASSQIHNDGTEIVIQPGTQVYTPGLHNDGSLLNHGAMIITGDWIQPDGKYSGEGQVIFTGQTPQLVQLNTTTIANVLVDNPAGLTLKGFMEIGSKLELQNGIVYTSEMDTLHLTSGTSLMGGSPASFISGPLHRAGTGSVFYPIGWNETYLPVTMEEIKGGNSLITTMEAKSNHPLTPGLPSSYELLEPYYWQRNSYKDAFGGAKIVLPLYDEFVDRSSIVMASASADLSAFDTPSEVNYLSGDYYTGVMSVNEIYGEVILLAMANPDMADAAPFYVPNAINVTAFEEDNRVIKVYGDISDEDFLYIVYDRTGKEVFKSEDLEFMRSTGWDGRMGQTGQMAPSGSYVYAVKGKSSLGATIDQTGQVIIIK